MPRRSTLVVLMMFIVGSGNASAAGRTLYSKAFDFVGRCGVQQAHYPWKGWDNVAWATMPWESTRVLITNVSVDIRTRSEGQIEAWEVFAGNYFTPDPMTAQRYFVGTGILDMHIESPAWPSGYGMAFGPLPGHKKLPSAAHIDVHINCNPPGAPYQGFLSVWYIKQ